MHWPKFAVLMKAIVEPEYDVEHCSMYKLPLESVNVWPLPAGHAGMPVEVGNAVGEARVGDTEPLEEVDNSVPYVADDERLYAADDEMAVGVATAEYKVVVLEVTSALGTLPVVSVDSVPDADADVEELSTVSSAESAPSTGSKVGPPGSPANAPLA